MKTVLTISTSGIVLAALAISGLPLIAEHPGLVGIVVGFAVAKLLDRLT